MSEEANCFSITFDPGFVLCMCLTMGMAENTAAFLRCEVACVELPIVIWLVLKSYTQMYIRYSNRHSFCGLVHRTSGQVVSLSGPAQVENAKVLALELLPGTGTEDNAVFRPDLYTEV